MAVTLAQVALTETNPLSRGVTEMFVQESAVFESIPIEPIAGNAYSYEEETVLPGTAFRTVNEAYIESTGVVNPRTERLTILGGDADVDRFLETTSSGSVADLRTQQTRMKVKSAQSTYTDALFNGDEEVNAKSFDGLRKRLRGKQVAQFAGTNTNANVIEQLDALFSLVDGGPDVVFANKRILGRLKSAFRAVGGAEYIRSEITGRTTVQWNGVSFVDPGKHWSNREILPITDNAAEVYAVKWASGFGDVGVMGISNGGVQAYDLGELQEKPAYRTRIEFYCGVAVQGGQAAARLTGFPVNTPTS
ncbi:major capsid protein [Sciscionella sediminilitoris]|uniref:major capsid protein n=1 Tax=Sciscionella sediminilitoris TaxID=1445613 RepID=UPI0004DF0C6C|nr:hypothetical protein [Sciscionella sp. SE31]